ncbi:MAG TPA: Dabb family protein [Acidobacteriota bacterium]|nr:Dabb family protein [Acidobacteriota bacterium]HOT00829.1 Dabb family protein [Acidobacteriota bacterium]HQF88452.1 Dabb family protein [Acidobacteriota bacterium]HQG92863.1 Dabb family protein [Acidobacteriota bacterium]HQK87856.1 Dabb family protein [Acidobacteriota bacterium]
MIRHIVIWRFEERADGRDKAENLRLAGDLLRGMAGRVDGLLHLEVGINGLPSSEASDLALVAEFRDWPALRAYTDHPVHQEVVRFLRRVRTERRVVDYEI